jgi:glycosyltransferase involved in cell wall biosynthesis
MSNNHFTSNDVVQAAVIIPTLNEAGNIVSLLDGILNADERLIAYCGGRRLELMAPINEYSNAPLSRRKKAANECTLSSAAKRWATPRQCRTECDWRYRRARVSVLQMDADFSHDPKYLPSILEKSKSCDLVIGSRYVPGGGTRNWGLDRKILSGGANALARRMLKLPARDCTGGFRCYKRELIECSGVLDVHVQGYAFLFVTLDLVRRAGARIGEVPIIFVDRQHGQSKMSRSVIMEAVRVLFRLWLARLKKHHKMVEVPLES